MKFNPNDYETVKSRKKRFYEDHTDGRIVVEMINPEEVFNCALFKAYIFLNSEDQKAGIPKATGYAYEVRDTELKESKSGAMYEAVNYSSWTENAEESAVGRALDNAGYSGNLKCSRDEMEKAQRMNKTMKNPVVEKHNRVKEAYKSISELFAQLHFTDSKIEKFTQGFIDSGNMYDTKDIDTLTKMYKTLKDMIK